jgi:acylphosphatase
MEITLDRAWKKDGYTISRLFINGERICEALEDTDRGLKQSMSLEEIKKLKIYGKTAIPSGRYKVVMSYSPKFGKVLPEVLDVKGYSGIRIHCLTPDMEVLTENGWQNLESYENNTPKNCYSYNTETRSIELVPIDNFIKYDYNGTVYRCDGRRVNYSVTDKHRMWVGCPTHNNGIVWSFRTADECPVSCKFMTAAYKTGDELSEYQSNFYKLIMATQADGYIYNRSNTSVSVVFHFVKQRKIDRVKELITSLGCSYSEMVDKEGKTHIRTEPKLSEQIAEVLNPCRYMFNYKELPIWLLSFDSSVLKELLMTYLFFDGRWMNYLKNNKNMIITSTNMNTLNVLQAMATCCGMRSYIQECNSPRCKEIVLYEGQEIVQPEASSHKQEQYEGPVWCLSNVNTTLIVRQNNRPFIIGNCGNTAKDTCGCILPGLNVRKGSVLYSTKWTNVIVSEISSAIKRGEEVWLNIK